MNSTPLTSRRRGTTDATLVAAGGTLLLVNAIMFSFSRGGLLSLIVTGGVAFVLIPKRPVHYGVLIAAILVGVRLAGKEVLARFFTTFADAEQRDASAESRLDLWGNCWDLMQRYPLFGVGPDHFGHYAHHDFGWPYGKEAHSLWFQMGAELGFVGVGLLIGFYVLCMWRLWPLTRESNPLLDPQTRSLARMVIASLAGFMLSSQFVSLEGLEFPYYVVLLGAATLKVASAQVGLPVSEMQQVLLSGEWPVGSSPASLASS
jgi:O-antigen ligase